MAAPMSAKADPITNEPVLNLMMNAGIKKINGKKMRIFPTLPDEDIKLEKLTSASNARNQLITDDLVMN